MKTAPRPFHPPGVGDGAQSFEFQILLLAPLTFFLFFFIHKTNDSSAVSAFERICRSADAVAARSFDANNKRRDLIDYERNQWCKKKKKNLLRLQPPRAALLMNVNCEWLLSLS